MQISNYAFLAWKSDGVKFLTNSMSGGAAAADDDDDEDDEDDKGEPEESLSAFPDLVPENCLSSSRKEEHK